MKSSVVVALGLLVASASQAAPLAVHYVCNITHTSIGAKMEYEVAEDGSTIPTGSVVAENFSGIARNIEIKGMANSMTALTASGVIKNDEKEADKNYTLSLLVGMDAAAKTPRVSISAFVSGNPMSVAIPSGVRTTLSGSRHKLSVNGLSTQEKINGKYESEKDTTLSVICIKK